MIHFHCPFGYARHRTGRAARAPRLSACAILTLLAVAPVARADSPTKYLALASDLPIDSSSAESLADGDAILQQARPVDGLFLLPTGTVEHTSARPIDYIQEEMPKPGEVSPLPEILKRLEALEKSVAKPPAAAEKKDAGWTDLSTEKWTVRLGGHMQADYVLWADTDPNITDPTARNYFEFRRLRLLADGTGYGQFDFRLQIDIEPEEESPVTTPVTVIKDAYFTMHDLPFCEQFRIGNFFVPFSLEQVTNDTNNIFMERSIPTTGVFSADREVGVAFYGLAEDKNSTWTTGVFFDSISEGLKERIDDNQGARVSGRVTWLPYYDEPSNGRYLVHTGAGMIFTDDQDGIARFRARPQIHEGPRLIDSGDLPASAFINSNIELATVWGPFSAQSELFLTNVNLDNGDNVNLYGSYVYFSYFLTGENRIYERFGQHGAQFARNVPYSNFFWVDGCCGPGAWEVKCRNSYLDLHEVGRGQYTDLTTGFNWYWTDRTRIMFDWIHPWTTAATVFGETSSDIIAMRFDYNF